MLLIYICYIHINNLSHICYFIAGVRTDNLDNKTHFLSFFLPLQDPFQARQKMNFNKKAGTQTYRN